ARNRGGRLRAGLGPRRAPARARLDARARVQRVRARTEVRSVPAHQLARSLSAAAADRARPGDRAVAAPRDRVDPEPLPRSARDTDPAAAVEAAERAAVLLLPGRPPGRARQARALPPGGGAHLHAQ